MMNFKKACLVATAFVMIAPAAFAGMHSSANDVVKTKTGNIVMNTFNNCVITKWESAGDECKGEKRATDLRKLSKDQRTVYFDFNKSTLNKNEKAKLDDLSKLIVASKEVESVDIVGYADMIGKAGYNSALSKKRANTVKSYLTSKGLKTRKTRVEGLGATKSVTKCDQSMARKDLIACLAADRRVEIELNFVK